MILLEPGEEMDFMFRAKAKIDGRKVGSGWFYSTDRRLVFESDKYGACFSIKPTDVDGQKAQRWGRFKFTWMEETSRGPWRFLFQGKIEEWNGWKPNASYVEWVLQDASYSKHHMLAGGWRVYKGTVYNQIHALDGMVPNFSGKTPEEQRLYRIWRITKAMLKDDDFDLINGKYDNDKTLGRLHKLEVEGIRIWLKRFRREYAEALKKAEDASDGPERDKITPESLEEQRIKCVVQQRILQIVEDECDGYTFGKQTELRVNELREILTGMCRRNEDISGAVPPTKVEPEIIQARKDVEDYRRRLTVKLPLF